MKGTKKKRRRSFLSRHPRLKKIAYTAYGLLLVPLFFLILPLGLIPRPIVYRLGKLAGLYIIYPLVRRRIEINLNYAYDGKLTDRRLVAIGKLVAITVAWSIVDCYYIWVLWKVYKINKIVPREEGWQYIEQAIKKGKGMFVATAHYNCFEVMPIYFLDWKRIGGGVIARSFPSPFLNWLNGKARAVHNVESYYDDIRGVVRALRKNYVIGVLPDLHARRRLGVAVTFYGKPTLTFDIHFRLAAKTGSLVIPAFMMRHKSRPWEYTLLIYPPIAVPRAADAETIRNKVQELNDVFEYHIRRYPSGWIWFHNKWRLF